MLFFFVSYFVVDVDVDVDELSSRCDGFKDSLSFSLRVAGSCSILRWKNMGLRILWGGEGKKIVLYST